MKHLEHSLLKSIILHLLPGLLGAIGCFLLVPIVKENGFPTIMALSLAGIFILAPFQLGLILYHKHKNNQKLFGEVIHYLKPLKIGQYILWVFVIILLSGLAFKAFNFTSEYLSTFFKWMPSLDMGLTNEYTKPKLILTYAVFLVFIVLVVPTIEELYFRGFLLPRLPKSLNGFDVVMNSALFAIYHMWTPWMFITRTIGILPLVYIVKKKENIRLGIISHCLLNSIDFFIGLAFIMKM